MSRRTNTQNTQKIHLISRSVNPSQTSLPENLRSEINDQLLATGRIQTIQTSLHTSLQKSGYLDRLFEEVLGLLRSGKYESDEDVLDVVLTGVREGLFEQGYRRTGVDEGVANAREQVKSDAVEDDEDKFKVPKAAVEASIRAVRELLLEMCEFKTE